MTRCTIWLFAALSLPFSLSTAQTAGEDAKPALGLWREPSDFPIPYAPMEAEQIETVMGRVVDYLAVASPIRIIDLDTEELLEEGQSWPDRPGLQRGLFSLISYEWGVTYAGMIAAGEQTGDTRYWDFVTSRLSTIARLGKVYGEMDAEQRPRRYPTRRLLDPHTLDHCGAMSAALIKARRSQASIGGLEPLFESGLAHISQQQLRLSDGTLARNRPLPNSLWLDDLYMSVPALAQMGLETGETSYFDDAAKQVLQFAQRMFVEENKLYRHGWVAGMEEHPFFPWGRANGWAFMAKAELLSAMPLDHPQRAATLDLFRAHAQGLVRAQGINGLWHQLLDRPETYEETSASAMFVFGLAKGINEGWLDAAVYGPATSLGWNAVSQQVNELGQVEGTCVGTGMGWDPAFYAYRNTNVYAAHGYGPVLLAGAEVLALMRAAGKEANLHDGAVHFGETPDW
ncbi:glycoside hydrolase family 88 protein [Pelagicoccus sp. SDUM812003]|uniref:glycoside hydrolase family 88/105 protein n=1 Tax=Pelagicoccus sp. SDUM812003 TaxID=3041267 RepID=UPI00280F4159|nr:glycoside hydrolase family 88 protein [Pelagicoccus sp. SDUM812003]MDQ8204900.1 glycoside hydrolase family 88 protein [Pelagicoccus sp. SDUM812003]